MRSYRINKPKPGTPFHRHIGVNIPALAAPSLWLRFPRPLEQPDQPGLSRIFHRHFRHHDIQPESWQFERWLGADDVETAPMQGDEVARRCASRRSISGATAIGSSCTATPIR
jgi:hypothetical protein